MHRHCSRQASPANAHSEPLGELEVKQADAPVAKWTRRVGSIRSLDASALLHLQVAKRPKPAFRRGSASPRQCKSACTSTRGVVVGRVRHYQRGDRRAGLPQATKRHNRYRPTQIAGKLDSDRRRKGGVWNVSESSLGSCPRTAAPPQLKVPNKQHVKHSQVYPAKLCVDSSRLSVLTSASRDGTLRTQIQEKFR